MIDLHINGIPVSVEEKTTVLEAADFLGIRIPTLCHMEGLRPYGACRLCVVEIGTGDRTKLVTSCTYPVEPGLKVRTASDRVLRARKMVIELMLGSCPQSKTIQDLAAKHGVRYFCPDQGDYTFDAVANRVVCTVHGNRENATQNPHADRKSSFAQVIESLDEIVASLRFEDDALITTVEIVRTEDGE